jgi:rhodanese-related sulfurtransferase
VLVANPGAETDSALRLGRIGFDNVRGFLDGGLASAAVRTDLLESSLRLAPDVAARRLADADAPLGLDVRTVGERATAAIAGTMHIPLTQLPDRSGEVAAERPVLVFCAGGYRSSIAASLLRQRGVRDVSEIAGGITAWIAAGLPLSATDS